MEVCSAVDVRAFLAFLFSPVRVLCDRAGCQRCMRMSPNTWPSSIVHVDTHHGVFYALSIDAFSQGKRKHPGHRLPPAQPSGSSPSSPSSELPTSPQPSLSHSQKVSLCVSSHTARITRPGRSFVPQPHVVQLRRLDFVLMRPVIIASS